MVQEIIIVFIFLLAAGYLLRMGYKSFFSKEVGCAKGCGGACSTIDLAKIQREIEAKQATR
ncbi:FeoB-associated Cys-rich membrane protein [Rufibacter latericius]|uniref:FeoB-associated Cys-rich membrane protein n=1 Tax=Rufibacter latericius TaxID=2487040 RepID=A0A3M9MDN2_9BACT|nr:FeoB-associated Cys-rich membrane protein [Rufibacter latericius]RNI23656.1 FeoB-associated Cys-rich membrane protein [Rufibacter latericius]